MPPSDLVTDYTEGTLIPQLQSLGLRGRKPSLVAEDCQYRLSSVLAHWHDLPVRKTILLLGLEEASFYEPQAASLDVRALVVVGVRNSLFEDVASTSPVTPALRSDHRMLTDSDVVAVTSAAIQHFQSLDEAPGPVALPGDAPGDLFDSLAHRYPRAWMALSHLANTPGLEVAYELPSGPVEDLRESGPPGGHFGTVRDVYLSGIDARLDPALVDYLRQIQQGEQLVFFSDSFKMISRNPEKLLRVIDFVLACGAAVVTHNYVLAPTAACRRQSLLRPFHGKAGEPTKFSLTAGLTDPHLDVLAAIHAALHNR